MRVFYATDLHGSEVCWRKFLNAAKAPVAMVICLAFSALFVGAWFVAQRMNRRSLQLVASAVEEGIRQTIKPRVGMLKFELNRVALLFAPGRPFAS